MVRLLSLLHQTATLIGVIAYSIPERICLRTLIVLEYFALICSAVQFTNQNMILNFEVATIHIVPFRLEVEVELKN